MMTLMPVVAVGKIWNRFSVFLKILPKNFVKKMLNLEKTCKNKTMNVYPSLMLTLATLFPYIYAMLYC